MRELPWKTQAVCVGRFDSFEAAFHEMLNNTLEKILGEGCRLEATEWSSSQIGRDHSKDFKKLVAKVGLSDEVASSSTKTRVIRVESGVPVGLPDALKSLVGDTYKVTVMQLAVIESTLSTDGTRAYTRALVHHKSKLHVLGGKLIKVKPVVEVTREDDTGMTYANVYVKVCSLLPPPLNAMAEGFIVDMTQRNLDAFFASFATS